MSGDDRLWEDQGSAYRPSYAATWLNCSGSFLPSQQVQDGGSEYAALGTVFHWLMAEWQTSGRPDSWLNQIFAVPKESNSTEIKTRDDYFEITVDDDMFFYGQECLDRYAHFPGDRLVEQKIDISDLTPIPDQSGTADLVILEPGVLRNIDWKYGLGIQVFAKWNEQELCYAWGIFKKWDWKYHFETIELHIAQPRRRHYDVFTLTREELIDWADWARNRASEAGRRNADRSPSPKACQWCKVRVDCSALEAARQALVDQTFDDAIEEPDLLMKPVTAAEMQKVVAIGSPAPRLPSAETLPTEQLARILNYRGLMESWFKQIGEELTTRALEGEDVPGWKIVTGRARRGWADENLAVEKLGSVGLTEELLYKRALVSPAQVEKLLRSIGIRGKLTTAFLRLIVDKPVGKPTLAPAGDNRFAIPNPVDETFEAEDEGDSL